MKALACCLVFLPVLLQPVLAQSNGIDPSSVPAYSYASAPSGANFSAPGSTSANASSFTKKQPGPLHRFLHAAADEVGGTAVALVGATIGNSDIDLPPDMEDNPSWPFNAPRRKSDYTIYWTNGASSKISRMPDGSLCVIGGGHSATIQKEPGGGFAILGEDGSMATLTPRLDGGYTLMKPDGSGATLLPRPGGGFNLVSSRGNVAVIIPGPGGNTGHVFSGSL